jgi:hypothetical protein
MSAKAEDKTESKQGSGVSAQEERREVPELEETPARPKKTKAQLWNEIKIICTSVETHLDGVTDLHL